MKKLAVTIAAVGAALMNGCASFDSGYIAPMAAQEALRFYEARTPEFFLENVEILWVQVSRVEMIAAGMLLAGTSEMNGFAIPPTDDYKCVVFVVDEQNTNTLSFAMGHEILHCFHGIWHDVPPPFGSNILSDKNRSKNFRPAAIAAAKIGFPKHFSKVAQFLSLNKNETQGGDKK